MKLVLLGLLGIILVIFAYDSIRTFFLVRHSKELMVQSIPYSRDVQHAAMSILVLGDSTAVGTGAYRPEDSTAGRLAAYYPDAIIVNRAVNGLKIEGLLNILKTIPEHERYDLVLIQIGANDIVRLTRTKKIEEGIQKVLARARIFGDKVIVLHSGDIGEAGIFPWYSKPLMTMRTLNVREIYKKEAAHTGAAYVDLFKVTLSSEDYASDQFHLSSQGYGVWFDKIQFTSYIYGKHLVP